MKRKRKREGRGWRREHERGRARGKEKEREIINEQSGVEVANEIRWNARSTPKSNKLSSFT